MRLKTLTISLFTTSILAFVGLWQLQNISDWLALRGYNPPARVAKLAADTTMNNETRRLFYINHPGLNDKATFRDNCVENGEQTIVLGCFIENNGIYLLDVNDPRLKGVIEVTAAHEVLHAAYDRLSDQERAQVDAWTASAFKNIQDQRIKDTIEQYRKKDPSVVPNELHSILGTEVEKLPKELEQYYSRYFSNRQKVVGYLQNYEQAFTDIRNQVKSYDRQLDRLKKSIDNNQANIDAQNIAIDGQRAELDRLLSAREIEKYNSSVPDFNQKVESYNALIAETKSLIESYNGLVDKRNQAVTNEEELVEALDSSKLTTKE